MEVGSDASAHALKLDHSAQAIAIRGVRGSSQEHSDQGKEPPSLPDMRQDGERDYRRRGTHNAVRCHCAHQKTITARRQVRKVDRALLGWCTPIRIGSFEFVLVTQ